MANQPNRNCKRPPARAVVPIHFDVVTPTYARPDALLGLARALRGQLHDDDRWIIVDDASPQPVSVDALAEELGVQADRIALIALAYQRTPETIGTVQRARSVGCEATRSDAWIVEIDDHDWPEPGALDLVRKAIRRRAQFVYGDVRHCDANGIGDKLNCKPDYRPYLLRDNMCPTEGIRAFSRKLYDRAGGYRWNGPRGLHGCEFPAGDYALFTRMELVLGGKGFVRIPSVLNRQPKVPDGISNRYRADQDEMAQAIRNAARDGTLL